MTSDGNGVFGGSVGCGPALVQEWVESGARRMRREQDRCHEQRRDALKRAPTGLCSGEVPHAPYIGQQRQEARELADRYLLVRTCLDTMPENISGYQLASDRADQPY